MYKYRAALFAPVLLSAAGTFWAWQRFKQVSSYCSYHIHLSCNDGQMYAIAITLTATTAVLLIVTAAWYVSVVRNQLDTEASSQSEP